MSEELETPVAEEKTKTAKRVSGITKDAALKVLVDANPKRPGSSAYDRFEGYFKDGIDTVQSALDAGLTMGDIKYDVVHESISVEGAVVEKYVPSRRGPRSESNDSGIEAPDDLMKEGDSAEGDSDDLFN